MPTSEKQEQRIGMQRVVGERQRSSSLHLTREKQNPHSQKTRMGHPRNKQEKASQKPHPLKAKRVRHSLFILRLGPATRLVVYRLMPVATTRPEVHLNAILVFA